MKGRQRLMRRNKLAWILVTAALCLVLYTLVVMRSDNKVSVILGGTEGAFIQSDGLTYVDPNSVTETPEPTVDIWPDIDITLNPMWPLCRIWRKCWRIAALQALRSM